MRKRWMFSPCHFEVFCILVCAGLVHASVCTPKKGISISPLNFSQNGHSVQKQKNRLSPFHLVVFSQTLCWLCPHCACAQKNWAVPFHYLVLCANSFPVLTGILNPFMLPFPSHLLLCIEPSAFN